MNCISEINEVTVSYTCTATEAVRTSSEAQDLCRKAYAMANANLSLKETFIILYFNRANKLIGFYVLSSGGLCGTIADLRIAFSVGLKCLATSMILVHNHPSSNKMPSNSDIALTKKFVKTGEVMDIKILDHIILTEEDYYSMADHCQMQ
ncbi:RadC-like JAB domain protein [anaerobic digester metagenome]